MTLKVYCLLWTTGLALHTKLNSIELNLGIAQEGEESLPELAGDVERLSRLAYPDATPGMIDVLAKDQFIDTITDEDIRLRIMLLNWSPII